MKADIRGSSAYQRAQAHFEAMAGSSAGTLAEFRELSASPAGDLLAATSLVLDQLAGVPQRRVVLMDSTTGNSTPLESDGETWGPVFSPAPGTLLAIERLVSAPPRLGVWTANGRRRVMAPDTGCIVEAARWTADGHAIVMLAAESGADRPAASGSGGFEDIGIERPEWLPEIDDGSDAGRTRRVWRWQPAAATLEPIDAGGLCIWEADPCGSAQVLAIASRGAREGDWYQAGLYLLDGSRQQLICAPDAQLALPRAAPNGRLGACIRGFSSDRTLVAGDILLVDLDGGSERTLDIAGVDATWIEWRSATRIVFMGMRGFETVVGETDITTGETRELYVTRMSLPRGATKYPGGALLPNGVVAMRDAYDSYPELISLSDRGVQSLKSLAHAGSEEWRARCGQHLEYSWLGRDGLEINGHLVLPPANGCAPPPLIVFAHGGPVYSHRNTWGLNNIFTPLLVREGFAVLHPDPRGSAARGQAFARLVQGDMGGEDVHDISTGIDQLARDGLIDAGSVAAMGRSYGGFISACLSMARPLSAVIAMNNAADWYSRHYTANNPEFNRIFLLDEPGNLTGRYFSRSLVRNAHRVCAPTLNVVGLMDRSSRATQGLSFHRALCEAGKTSTLVSYRHEGHHIDRIEAQIDLCGRMLSWLDRHLVRPARSRGHQSMGDSVHVG